MRQAGILAAAGLYALEHHRPHLDDDHEKARRLAETLDALPAFEVDRSRVQTNIVMARVPDTPAAEVVSALEAEDVFLTPFGPHTIRLTTHRDVSMADIETAGERIRATFAAA
jgi:threonine aldolase